MEKLEVLQNLRLLRDVIKIRKDRRPDWFGTSIGLCTNWKLVTPTSQNFTKLFKNEIRSWKKFSGDDLYPVRGVLKSPSEEYYETDDLYNQNTVYGKNRFELLNHIISCIEKE